MIGSFKKSLILMVFFIRTWTLEEFKQISMMFDLSFGFCVFSPSGGLAWPQERLQLHIDLSPMPC